MTTKEISHQKYESLSQEDKEKLRQWAIQKLPTLLKTSESAIMNKIYIYKRSK